MTAKCAQKKDRQLSITVSPLIEEISGLVVVTTWLVITATASFDLAVGTAGHCAALTILDGDGLYGGGVSQRDGLAIERALSTGVRTIYRVADLST